MYKKKNSFCYLFVGLLLSELTVSQDILESKEVVIKQGPVRGYKSKEHGIFEFTGIPYATAPTGTDKFKAPLPGPTWIETLEANMTLNLKNAPLAGPTWTETLEANITNITCPQLLAGGIYQDLFELLSMEMKDDCLIANIYTPATEEINLPVVVIVYGGAYQLGWSGLLVPKFMVGQGNFIAVDFNYRLGIHGFLCLGTEDIPGNAGMKDQVAALRWVKENIVSFGGNPNDITLTGYSAGASAAELLMLSETTHDLFNKVVPESGAAMAAWSVQQDPTEFAKEFAKSYLQFETDDIQALNDFYKTKPLEELMVDNDNVARKDSTFFFVPCVERDTGSENIEIFLKDAPIDILKNSSYYQLPMLVGFAEMEGIFRLDKFEQWNDRMNQNFADFLPIDLIFESVEQKEKVAQKVKRYYFGYEEVNIETMQNYINYFSDVLFAYPALRSLRLQVEAGNRNVYLYEYSFIDNTHQSVNPYKYRGAGHVAQTLALFDTAVINSNLYSKEYRNTTELLRKLWINFYKTGIPVTGSLPELPQGWPASSANVSPYMNLDYPPLLKGILLENRTKFWDHIYEQHYRKPIPPRSHGFTLILKKIFLAFIFY